MNRAVSIGVLVLPPLMGWLGCDLPVRAGELDDPAYFADQDVMPEERPVPIAPPAVILAPAEGPAIFGWHALRPLSCGEYRYWNGIECLDARDVPPDIGPRW